jgi:thioredoxin-related protein
MKVAILLLTILFYQGILAQNISIYKPEANAKAEIQQAIQQAKAENKHVFLQIGGNWCSWCIKFHQFVEAQNEIKRFVNENFVVLKVNHSTENKNFDVLKSLDYPQRFGFPVFVILDENGKRIHTQCSAYLENDGGYSEKKVLTFFKQWSPTALDDKNYEK